MADFSSTNITKNYLSTDMKTLKVLAGVAHGVYNGSLALQLSKSPKTLNVQGDIKTKRVRVFLPFAGSVANFETIFQEYIQNGAIRTDGLNLGEQEIQLGYDAITVPVHWRPKIGEQLQAPQLLGIYKDYFTMAMIKHVDSNYLANITNYVINGVPLGDPKTAKFKTQGKVRVLNKTDFIAGENDSMDDVKKKAYQMLARIRNDVAEVVQYEDLISTKSWDPSEMVIIAKPGVVNLIKNEIRYNIYNSYAASNDGIGSLKVQDEVRPIGQLDGIDVYVSKFLPENVELIIQIKGTAKEIFAMKKHLNFDKVPGILTYKMSLEYQGGTGVFFPHLSTIYTSDSKVILSKTKYDRNSTPDSDNKQGKFNPKEVAITVKYQERQGFRKIDMEKQISPNFYQNMDENNFQEQPPTPTKPDSPNKRY